MRILRLEQGSSLWHQHRATRFNASDAPAMLGESPHASREQLLLRMKTGVSPEVDGATQRRFDDGHAVEALLRKVAEDMLGEPLYPFVGVPDDEASLLSASFDGSTFVGETAAESKLLNARLRAAFKDMETIAPEHRERSAATCLPIDYRIQMEQQLRVAQAERVLFLAGELRDDGTLGDTFTCWYYPDDALWKRIELGWAQFKADLESFEPQPKAERVVAAPVEALPAVSVRMDGALAVHSNLDVFGAKLREFIARIPAAPTSDQDFADCDAACKALKRAEEALDGAEASALGQVQSVEQLTRTITDLRNVARTARLVSEKVVKARKEQIRLDEVQRGRRALDAHVLKLNEQIGAEYMPAVLVDFGAAISGKKTLDSLRAAVDQLLADKKIEANEIAGRITTNLRTMKAHGEYDFLFADLKSIVTKQPEDFQALVQSRVLAHQVEEQRRAEAAAERERERIRREESIRLRQEQENEAASAAAQALAQSRKAGSLPPELQSELEDVAASLTADLTIGRAANSSMTEKVASLVPRGAPTLKLGDINARLAPVSITEAGLARLGFVAAGKQGAACLFHEADFAAICDSLVAHIRTAQQRATEAQAA